MRTTMYLHSSKETNWEIGERLGLKGEALLSFRHALSEVEVQIEVNPETGDATILAVDGRKLAEKGATT